MPYSKSNGGSSSFDLDNDRIFADVAERDAYFTSNPDDLVDNIYSSVSGILYKYANNAWTDVSQLIKGDSGSNGSNGLDGKNAPELMIQFSEFGDSEWHESRSGEDNYWRWSTDGGVIWSDDFVRFSANLNIDIATVSSAGIVKPDGTTITVSLDGTISSDVAAATKVSLSSESEMLSLSQISNLYIVTRTDLERIWYLNADTDPSLLSNWVEGASVADTVASFKGFDGPPRNGAVVAATGDYMLDMVQADDTSTGVKYYLEITDGKLFMVEV